MTHITHHTLTHLLLQNRSDLEILENFGSRGSGAGRQLRQMCSQAAGVRPQLVHFCCC